MDLAGYEPERVDRLDVTWPSARLRRFTLIDTPGLEAHDEASSARAGELLGADGGPSGRRRRVPDATRAPSGRRLLEPFVRPVAGASVARERDSRAVEGDEIGAGRPDALDSAATIAARYAADHRIRTLCAAVVPVAGLIGETGRTLVESEGDSLRTLADMGTSETAAMLRSVDRFIRASARSPLDPDTRHELLLRLGLFGTRLGIDHLRRPGTTTSTLARSLVEASGVDRLAALLDEHFGRHAELLKARSALANLKELVAQLDALEALDLSDAVERVETAAPRAR